MTGPTTTPFTPCPSRFQNREGDTLMYGCLRPTEDGHQHESGPSHVNHGRSWSDAAVYFRAPRCESTILDTVGAAGTVWRCVEDAGHYPASIHAKHGYPPKGWTDEMSLNPPPSLSPTEAVIAKLGHADAATVQRLAVLWAYLGSDIRSAVKAVSADLFAMLHRLVVEVNDPATEPPEPTAELCGDRFVSPGDQREDAYVCDGKPGHLLAENGSVMHGGSNRQGKTAAWGDRAGLGDHPAEPTVIKLSVLRDKLSRAADLIQHKQGVIDELAARLEDQHRRVEALRQAVAWSTRRRVHPVEFAEVVTRFERYLHDGTPTDTMIFRKGPAMQSESVQPTDTETPPPVQRGGAAYAQQQRDNERDSADMERIRAWWTNHSPEILLVQYDGDAVAATLAALDASLNP